MEELSTIKQKLLKSIETLTTERQTRLERFIDPRISNTFETKYIENYRTKDNEVPETITFKTSLINRILPTAFLLSIILFGFIVGYEQGHDRDYFFGFSFFAIFYIAILIKIWFTEDSKNKLTLSKNGIAYNNVLYLWKDILGTHIQYVYKGGNQDHEGYLYIGMKTGSLEMLDISKLQFGFFLFDSSAQDDLILGHYIEVFKKRNK